jgi:hypothetical protein
MQNSQNINQSNSTKIENFEKPQSKKIFQNFLKNIDDIEIINLLEDS